MNQLFLIPTGILFICSTFMIKERKACKRIVPQQVKTVTFELSALEEIPVRECSYEELKLK